MDTLTLSESIYNKNNSVLQQCSFYQSWLELVFIICYNEITLIWVISELPMEITGLVTEVETQNNNTFSALTDEKNLFSRSFITKCPKLLDIISTDAHFLTAWTKSGKSRCLWAVSWSQLFYILVSTQQSQVFIDHWLLVDNLTTVSAFDIIYSLSLCLCLHIILCQR